MKTKLDILLESIDPERTMESVSKRVDNALNAFDIKAIQITDWHDFQDILTRFFRHLENHVLNVHGFKSPYKEMDWGRCFQLLKKEYGQNGEKAAFEYARTGVNGGLYEVLKKTAFQAINEYSDNEIRARISRFWHSLSVNEQLSASKEYLEKYGHLLP